MRLYFICVLSIAIHLLVWTGVDLGAYYFPAPKASTIENVEIEISSPENQILEALTPKRQVVRNALAPHKLKVQEDDTLARYLSESQQRVQEQTQAAKTGMTKNRSGQGPPKTQLNSHTGPDSTDHSPSILDQNGFERFNVAQELRQYQEISEGVSTVGEYLPDSIKVGSVTALNTDRFLFYTFYARVEELTRFRWESRIQQALQSLPPILLKQGSDRNWVTQVEFLLNRNGQLEKALLMKSSGVPSFDLAAIQAFKEARIFPNPAPEMIQEDGYIHLKYSFTVRYSTPALANGP